VRERPKLATRLLTRFGARSPGLVGDLLETYESGRSRWWYWRQIIAAIVLPLIRVRVGEVFRLEAFMERAAVYMIGALALGGLTAAMQGFGIGGSQWVAAAIGGPVAGLGVGAAKRLFIATDVSRWAFWVSFAVLGLTALGAQCAMCLFVG
jgi:hypothetical protein